MIKWTAVERGKFTRYYEVHQRDVSKNECPRLTVICRLSDMATPEAKAIANLIAAAPQMLEALEELEPFLQWLVIEQGDKVDKLLENKILPAIKAAKGKV